MARLRWYAVRSTLLTLAFVAGALALSRPAQAQSITARVLSVGGRNVEGDLTIYVNGADCSDDGAQIALSLRNVPTTKAQLDFWRGDDCTTADSRRPMTGTCTYLTSNEITAGELTLNVPVADLIDCEAGTATVKVFVLGVNSAMSTEEVGTDYALVTFKVDTVAPNAPTGVEDAAGESAIPVSWDVESTTDLRGFRVYVDATASDCTSATLAAGSAPPSESVIACSDSPSGTLRCISTTEGTRRVTVSAPGLGLAVGERAAAFVAAVDDAGNVSVLSAKACLEYVDADGFWDRYLAERGGSAPDTCAVGRRPDRGGTPLAAAAIFLVGCACLVRSRRGGR